MEAETLRTHLAKSFGDAISVRTRRPGRVFQLCVPAYLPDGDAANIFVQQQRGALRVSDLGHTRMRISYTREIDEPVENKLAALAERHGFFFGDGQFFCEVASGDLAAAVFGLTQIEGEAEAILEPRRAREDTRAFHAAVRDALIAVFGERCKLDEYAESDKERAFGVEAVIYGPSTSTAVAIVANDVEAERAVGTYGHRGREFRFWTALPRDVNDLTRTSRTRLMKTHLVPMPTYEPDAGAIRSAFARMAFDVSPAG